jgi:hypothetical protein
MYAVIYGYITPSSIACILQQNFDVQLITCLSLTQVCGRRKPISKFIFKYGDRKPCIDSNKLNWNVWALMQDKLE